MQMGNTLQGTLLSVRGGIESFSPTQIGAVGAGFWVGIVIGSLRAGKLVQAVGHIRAFLALGAIASTAPLLHLLIINPIAWVAARALTGLCFAGLFIVVESWLNSAATDQTRGQILSVYAMTGLVGGIAGQLLLPASDPAGFRPFCIVAIIIAFALVPIALIRADRGRESACSPSLRTGQALFTHPALQLMGSNSETEVFEFSDSLWLYRSSCRAAVRLNSPASSKKRMRQRW
jgi:MFS family permease